MIFVYRMNPQWLTTLMSNMKSQLESQLESRGLRLSTSDVTALLEEISPKASHAALGYAADLLRPFSMGMGMRISRLSDSQVEVILPARTRNMNEHGQVHEAAILGGAIEAARALWERHAPLGEFRFFARKVQIENFKPSASHLRLRLELGEALRESVLADLRKRRQSKVDLLVQAYDEKDIVVAEINLHLELQHIPSLFSPSKPAQKAKKS